MFQPANWDSVGTICVYCGDCGDHLWLPGERLAQKTWGSQWTFSGAVETPWTKIYPKYQMYCGICGDHLSKMIFSWQENSCCAEARKINFIAVYHRGRLKFVHQIKPPLSIKSDTLVTGISRPRESDFDLSHNIIPISLILLVIKYWSSKQQEWASLTSDFMSFAPCEQPKKLDVN